MSRLTVFSVEGDPVNVTAISDSEPRYVMGRVSVTLRGSSCSVVFDDWRDAQPNVGDVYDISIERAERQ